MKLILCKKCGDVFKLSPEEIRTCSCGTCRGKYIDDLNAWYEGVSAVPLGIDNMALAIAVKKQPKYGLGEPFYSFIIPKHCKTFENKT